MKIRLKIKTQYHNDYKHLQTEKEKQEQKQPNKKKIQFQPVVVYKNCVLKQKFRFECLSLKAENIYFETPEFCFIRK